MPYNNRCLPWGTPREQPLQLPSRAPLELLPEHSLKLEIRWLKIWWLIDFEIVIILCQS